MSTDKPKTFYNLAAQHITATPAERAAADEYPVLVGRDNQGFEIYDWCDENCPEGCMADHKGEQ